MLPVARVPVHPASVQRAVTACVGLGFTRLTSRLWLVERRLFGPVIRALERATDPLLRQAG